MGTLVGSSVGGGEVIPAALAGERVDRVVSFLFALSRGQVAALVEAGAVSLGGVAVKSRSRRVAEGDVLDVASIPSLVPDELVAETDVDYTVVYEDSHVVVVDKPSGLVVHPGAGHTEGTLAQGLLARYPEMATVGQVGRSGIVHRLDVGTSGLLVAARTPGAYDSLVAQLAARQVERRYFALVWGHFAVLAGEIDAPIGRSRSRPTAMAVNVGGRPARTRYQVLEQFCDPAEVAFIECQLGTGRTHQIRVHLSAIGHAVVGDHRYRGAFPSLPSDRPFLHAHRLAFDHPESAQRTVFTSPLPSALEEIRAGLL